MERERQRQRDMWIACVAANAAFGNPYISCVNKPDDFSISYGDKVFIGDIVDACAPYTTSQLTEITRHQSPWMDTYHAGHRVISEAAIAKFFFYVIDDLIKFSHF